MKGKIKTYDAERGFGIITDADTGQDVFFYSNGIKNGGKIKAKYKVVFDVYNGKKGIIAVNIEIDED